MLKSKLKLKSSILILINIFLICIIMVIGVFAWFCSRYDNTADTYDITIQGDDAFDMSFDNKTWYSDLNFNDFKDETGKSVMSSLKLIGVTGNIGSFFTPELTQKSNYALVNTDGTCTNAVKNKDYLDFNIYMRSLYPLDVYLGSESKASPIADVLTGADCDNKSDYGNFSKDCVVGALRIAGFSDNGSNQKFLWITNPEIHLNNAIGSNDYSVTTNATSLSNGNGDSNFAEGKNYYWNNSYKHYYYANPGQKDVGVYSTNILLGEDIPNTQSSRPSSNLTQLTELSTKDSNGYYSNYARFVIWLEGCDTEARRALMDGRFSIDLKFDSFSR